MRKTRWIRLNLEVTLNKGSDAQDPDLGDRGDSVRALVRDKHLFGEEPGKGPLEKFQRKCLYRFLELTGSWDSQWGRRTGEFPVDIEVPNTSVWSRNSWGKETSHLNVSISYKPFQRQLFTLSYTLTNPSWIVWVCLYKSSALHLATWIVSVLPMPPLLIRNLLKCSRWWRPH